MGIFSDIKEIFKFRKEIKNIVEKSKADEALYLNMSKDEMSNLSDDDLISAVLVRTEHTVEGFDEPIDGLNALNYCQKVFYSLNCFEMEVNDGGLCQFFVNSSKITAPFISEYMGVVGADEHKTLFDKFISDNKIDLSDLSLFDLGDLEDYEEQTKIYPFDEYDNAYSDLEPIETYLKKYVREHFTDF